MLEQMNNITDYSNLTKEKLEDTINMIFLKSRSTGYNNFYTGINGYKRFTIALYVETLNKLNLPKEKYDNIIKLLFSNLEDDFTLATVIINNLKSNE